jgi:hypothetical protein
MAEWSSGSIILDLGLASRPGRFTPWESAPGTDRMGGLYYVSGKRKRKCQCASVHLFLYFFDESEFSNRLL